MEYTMIRMEVSDRLAMVTINRPDKLNALSATVIAELHCCFMGLREDPTVGAVILTGAGSRAFVAGADIAELAQMTPTSAREVALAGQALTIAIETLGKPVIAAISGFALGGGLELALACSLRIAHPRAQLGAPEVKLGIIPGFGGTQRLARLVGRGKALELILGGDPIDGREAHRIGLVDRLIEPADLPADKVAAAEALREAVLSDATRLARAMLSRAPIALRYALDAVDQGERMPLHDALKHEAGLFGLAAATRDFAEGTAAFLSKREPSFTGQ
jgi:enoyl-CoA hydratase